MAGGLPEPWQQNAADGNTRPIFPGPCVLGNPGAGRSDCLYLSWQLQLLLREAPGAYRQPPCRNSTRQQPISHRVGVDASHASGPWSQSPLPRRSFLRTREDSQAAHRGTPSTIEIPQRIYWLKNLWVPICIEGLWAPRSRTVDDTQGLLL